MYTNSIGWILSGDFFSNMYYGSKYLLSFFVDIMHYINVLFDVKLAFIPEVNTIFHRVF